MTPIVFKPRPSSGWLTLGGIGFVLLAYSVAILASSINGNVGLGFLWPLVAHGWHWCCVYLYRCLVSHHALCVYRMTPSN